MLILQPLRVWYEQVTEKTESLGLMALQLTASVDKNHHMYQREVVKGKKSHKVMKWAIFLIYN